MLDNSFSELERRIDCWPHRGPYRSVCGAVAGESPDRLRGLMGHLSRRFVERTSCMHLPGSVMAFYERDIARIASDTITQPDTFYDPNSDVFIKDLCIASQRMVPAGAQVVHKSGIPRRWMLRARDVVIPLFLLRVGGRPPWFEIHTHYPVIGEFNEQGWISCYRRIAEMLDAEQDVKGVFGSSWFFDPEVARVSPRLSYLRDIPMRNGAFSIRLGTSESDISLATKKSNTRRTLYERGEYFPVSYALIWPRSEVLGWARRS